MASTCFMFSYSSRTFQTLNTRNSQLLVNDVVISSRPLFIRTTPPRARVFRTSISDGDASSSSRAEVVPRCASDSVGLDAEIMWGGEAGISDEEDVLFVYEKDYRSNRAGKSLGTKTKSLVEKAKSAGDNIVRFLFGKALFASVSIVYTPILPFISLFGHAEYVSSHGGNIWQPFLWYLRLSKGGKSTYKKWSRKQFESDLKNIKNFRASAFSFVFGDGDPNQGREEKQWKLIGKYIATNGGVVTAEELAPYLDLKTTKELDDDSYILPVLARFDGQPEVNKEGCELDTEIGNIIYRFPSFQRRRGQKENVGAMEKIFKENRWKFSKTSMAKRYLIVGLGGLNLVGVITLGTLLKSTAITPAGLITSALLQVLKSTLQIYAASYFAIPFIRWFIVSKRNKEIERRNLVRETSVRALEKPDPSLRRKLFSARDMAQRLSNGQDRIVDSTENVVFKKENETQKWDRRLLEIEKSE